MPRIRNNRQTQIRHNISGGTAAPRAAARGPRTGLGQSRPVFKPQAGLGPGRSASGAGKPGGAPVPQVSTTAPTPMPWDVAAQNSIAGAAQTRDNTLAGLSSQWGMQQQAFGLEGPWADFKTNPYSQAALLQRSYDIANRGAKTGAGLSLYSGSQVNQRGYNTRGYNENRDQLQKAYAAEFAKYTAAKQAAENAYREAVSQAEWDKINTGLASEPDAEAAPAPGGGGRHRRRRRRRRAR